MEAHPVSCQRAGHGGYQRRSWPAMPHMSDSTLVSAGTGKASWDWGMPGGSPPARSSSVQFTPRKILCQPHRLWPTPVDWVLGRRRRSALIGANPFMLDDGCYCVSVHWLCIPIFFQQAICSSFWCLLAETRSVVVEISAEFWCGLLLLFCRFYNKSTKQFVWWQCSSLSIQSVKITDTFVWIIICMYNIFKHINRLMPWPENWYVYMYVCKIMHFY